MYVCVCRAITDRDIQHAVRNGADTFGEVRRTLQMGGDCGLCSEYARQCYKSAKENVTCHGQAAGCG